MSSLTMLTKDHAEKIARKLGAKIVRSKRNHDLAIISHEGLIIASFGIRRSSRRDKGHDHIPRNLRFAPHQCIGLANCPVSKDDWLNHMRTLGLVE